MRHKEVHLINVPTPLRYMYDVISAILTEKMRSRFKVKTVFFNLLRNNAEYYKMHYYNATQYKPLLDKLMKATVLAESSNKLSFFHCHLCTPAMSTESSQVGVTIFPSF